MPQSQEKTPGQSTELPNPELNPLLNPTLGRHLGRWAQVYFTSPPEKREEAVEELLRELQGNPPATQETAAIIPLAPPTLDVAPVETIHIVEAVADLSSLKCAECGHLYTSPQRFCGMCGATLEEEHSGSETNPRAHSMRTVEPLFTHADLPSLTPVSESMNPPEDDYSDIRWLREKSLSDSGSSWRRARYAPAMIAVLAIGILFYAQSRPQKAPGQQPAATAQNTAESAKSSTPPPSPTAAEAAPVTKAAEPVPTTPHEPVRPSPDQTKPPVRSPSEAAAAIDNPRPPAADRVPSATSPAEPAAALNPANGAAELAMAEDFLNGKTHPRNSEEAAKYLWRAVGKENPTAILLLSDMYQVGDGVPKSCDQARLLLSAAAKKGVPQAAVKLGDLLRSGCPK